jgi:hypothetical protein
MSNGIWAEDSSPSEANEQDLAATLLAALRLPRQGQIYELGTQFGSTMPQGPASRSADFT